MTGSPSIYIPRCGMSTFFSLPSKKTSPNRFINIEALEIAAALPRVVRSEISFVQGDRVEDICPWARIPFLYHQKSLSATGS